MLANGKVQLDIRVDDQEQPHLLLRQGARLADASVPLHGHCKGAGWLELGAMVYQLLCTPAFARRWFP